MNLTVSQEYASLLPKLSELEYGQLKASIQANGLFLPIVVNSSGIVLDGHHRLKVCEELGREPKYEIKGFPSIEHEREFVIRVNLERRQLNDFQKAELGMLLLPIEQEKAKRRELAGTTLGSIDPRVGKAIELVAEDIGLSPKTFQRAKKIIEEAPEELKEELRQNKKTIFSAYQQLQREIPKEYPPIPEGQFDVIYADPPWQYEFSLSDMGDPESFYRTLPTDEICKLPIPSAENSILFLWATNPKLKEALQVMEAWGFQYKTNLVWVKDRIGNGYYFRGQHELLLLGVKGKIGVPFEGDRPSSVLTAPRTEHSHKPNEVYELIERMYPKAHYLELFATQQHDKWEVWGSGL